MRHAASLRLETAATHGSAFAVSKSALSIHSYVDMGGVGPPSEKNRFSASTASADEPNTHFVHSVADFNNLSTFKWASLCLNSDIFSFCSNHGPQIRSMRLSLGVNVRV